MGSSTRTHSGPSSSSTTKRARPATPGSARASQEDKPSPLDENSNMIYQYVQQHGVTVSGRPCRSAVAEQREEEGCVRDPQPSYNLTEVSSTTKRSAHKYVCNFMAIA